MKVVHILYSGLGGHGYYFFSFENGARKSGLNITNVPIFFGIEAMQPRYKEECDQLGMHYEYVQKEKGPAISSHKKIYRILQEQQPDAIIIHSSLTLPVCSLYRRKNPKTKILFVEHQANHLKRKSEWLWSRMSMLLSDRNIYLTQLYYEQVKETLGSAFNDKKATVITTGIDLEKYRRDFKDFSEGEEILVGMQGRLMYNKDHATLIRATIALRTEGIPIKLLLAGDGDARPMLEEIVKEGKASEYVVFYGMLGEKDLDDFMRSLHIYVHATYGETMSTAIMQAQAFGLPIIASDVSGVNNVISHGENGLLTELENTENLIGQLRQMIQDNTLRKNLSKASLHYAEEHLGIDKMFSKYAKLMNLQA